MDATFPPALLGYAAAALRCAHSHVAQGLHGRAAAELAAAAEATRTCTRLQPALAAGWKLRGDVLVTHAHCHVADDDTSRRTTTTAADDDDDDDDDAQATVATLRRRSEEQAAAVRGARAAYARVVHLTPWSAPSWVDLASALVGAASLQRAAPASWATSGSSAAEVRPPPSKDQERERGVGCRQR
jgi:hypothetical protein